LATKSTSPVVKTGIVIPCFNEGNRLIPETFIHFQKQNPHFVFCFVNDGSQDTTEEVIMRMNALYPESIRILNQPSNQGKAEAVRSGIEFLLKDQDIVYLGYLDADLSTSLEEFANLVCRLQDDATNIAIVCGSRVKRMGAQITRQFYRHYIGRFIATLISIVLQMPFYDTQCGAKVFTRAIGERCFRKPFVSKWLFDVEIFLRMKIIYGASEAQSLIYEYPLEKWIHKGGSKIGWKDVLYTPWQLLRIASHYLVFKRYSL